MIRCLDESISSSSRGSFLYRLVQVRYSELKLGKREYLVLAVHLGRIEEVSRTHEEILEMGLRGDCTYIRELECPYAARVPGQS